MFTSTSTPLLYQELINLHYSRRMLLLQHHHPLLHQTPPTPATPPTTTTTPIDPTEPYNGTNGFDANVVMVLSVLLCALICSLGLNSIIKCALRCSSLASTTESNNNNNNNNQCARLANTGVKRKALKTFAVVNYSPELKLPGLDSECVICLSEFVNGDRVRLLPKCNHGFHVKCIDKWLNSHSSCPTCRHCLIETCHKIVGSSSQVTTINIAPLERENMVRSYRVDSPL